MKAILVINLNEDVKLDDLEISYVIQDKFGTVVEAEVDGVKLKPIPEEDDEICIKSYLLGFNACLYELSGEEEWRNQY